MIAINIDPTLELVTIKFAGPTTTADLIVAMQYCASSYLWRDHYNYFFDMREIVVGFSIADYPQLIENIHKLKPKENAKHACVVAGHTHYAFSLAWEKIAALNGIQFKSSFACQELSDWLGLSVSKIAETLESEPLFTFSTDDLNSQPQK